MKAAKQGQLDLPMVIARAATIHQADHVPYWIVLDYQDGLELLKGLVPDTVRSQIVGALRREPTEGQAEYLARVAEGAPA